MPTTPLLLEMERSQAGMPAQRSGHASLEHQDRLDSSASSGQAGLSWWCTDTAELQPAASTGGEGSFVTPEQSSRGFVAEKMMVVTPRGALHLHSHPFSLCSAPDEIIPGNIFTKPAGAHR